MMALLKLLLMSYYVDGYTDSLHEREIANKESKIH